MVPLLTKISYWLALPVVTYLGRGVAVAQVECTAQVALGLVFGGRDVELQVGDEAVFRVQRMHEL